MCFLKLLSLILKEYLKYCSPTAVLKQCAYYGKALPNCPPFYIVVNVLFSPMFFSSFPQIWVAVYGLSMEPSQQL